MPDMATLEEREVAIERVQDRIRQRRKETYGRLEGRVLGIGVLTEDNYLAKICDAVYEDVLTELDELRAVETREAKPER
jgi:hypothetical protein